jgi:signal transduction histidine kinase
VDLRPRAADTLNVLLLAGVYVAAARVGLLFEPVGGFASLVWAPSGIALVALVLHGLHLWPGVFLGAAIANALVGATIPVAIGIGFGNTLGALAGAMALHRLDFDVELHDTRSAIRLVAVSVAAATIPATIGAAILVGAQGVQASGAAVWRAWWIGDTIGNRLVTALVLVWNTRRAHTVATPRRVEFLLALLVNATIGWLIFVSDGGAASRPAAYLLFPTLIWAAVRFGARGAVTTVTLVAAVAIFGTANGRGPFAGPALSASLLGLQTFVGVAAATFLVLGATIAERRRAAHEALEAREHAEEANRAKAEFLAVMSHELRTPLNAISGFVDLLLIGAQGPLTEPQRNSLERVKRNQYHLLALINDLLAFTRLEAGKVKLEITRVAVSRAIDDVEPIIQGELRRKELIFVRDSVDAGLVVKADADKLSQVLLNLLTNAAKYSEAAGTVTIGAEEDGDQVRIWVRDTGIGIPADQLDKVFEPFFQVDRGRTRKYPGVGLGLTIARDLARTMGGDVAAESALGRGTTVTIRLPRG